MPLLASADVMDQPQQATNNHSNPLGPKNSWNDDIFSIRTIAECEQIFEEYCEQKVDQFSESKEKLSILRSCLDLLNRLEGTTYRQFAGRVLIFLARVIPLYDQSGVNLRSDFSPYDLPSSVERQLEQREVNGNQNNHVDNDIEEGETISDDEEGSDKTNTHQEDTLKLYDMFWRVQQYLHQPNQLYDQNTWSTFRILIDALVVYFEHKPSTREVWNLRNSYMTEPKAFSLQLNDVNFRRCFLVQILIALQYLDMPVETRPDSLILKKHQAGWIDTTTARIYSILASTPTKETGKQFCGLVNQVLKCEELWNQWKNEKCKEPKLPADNEDDDMLNMGVTYHKRRKLSDELKCAKPYNLHVIGGKEMSNLWNRRPHQPEAPDLAKYFAGSEESFKDANASFRILRLLRKSPFFFKPTKDSIKSLDEYLKNLSDKYS